MSSIKHLCLLGVIIVGSLPAQAQNFLLNPSFELPAVGNGNRQTFHAGQTIGVGWVVDSASFNVLVADKGYNDSNLYFPPTQGNQYLFLGDVGGAPVVRQDVTLAAGGPYKLTFDLGNNQAGNNPGTGVTLDVINLSDNLSVVGGPQAFTRPPGAAYSSQELDFSAPQAGDYRVLIANTAPLPSYLDNFALVASVPEPASFGFLAAIGALSFAVVRRYRRCR